MTLLDNLFVLDYVAFFLWMFS